MKGYYITSKSCCPNCAVLCKSLIKSSQPDSLKSSLQWGWGLRWRRQLGWAETKGYNSIKEWEGLQVSVTFQAGFGHPIFLQFVRLLLRFKLIRSDHAGTSVSEVQRNMMQDNPTQSPVYFFLIIDCLQDLTLTFLIYTFQDSI